MLLECPLESSFGYESKVGERHYVELDPVGVSPTKEKATTYTCDSAAFWARP